MNTKIDNILKRGHGWGKSLFALLLMLMTLPLQMFGSHIVGGEIGYRCLGNDRYEVTLDLYRDCFYGAENAQFDDPASIGIFHLNNNSLFAELKIDFIEDDTLDAILNDPCLFVPGDVCVHTTTYRDTVTLPPSDIGYKLVYQRCCRNQTIANIEDPFNTGTTYEIDLIPSAMATCNGSPRFRTWPPIFICVDRPITYDHSAIDPEGDSLVYKLCTPNQGATFNAPQPQPPRNPPYDPVIFVGPTYSLSNLLGFGNPLKINPRTGLLTGRPTMQGQFVVGVCVEEYRDGVLISETRRDFQYNVGRCEEVEAVINAPSAQCENLTVEFSNNSVQADDFEWHFDYPNDPRAISTEANPTYTYPDTGRYTVMLIAEPNTACVDTSFTEIYLQSNSLFVDFEIEKADCASSSVLGLVDFSTDTISDLDSHLWQIVYNGDTITSMEQNPVIGVPLGVRGSVTLTVTSVNGCVRSVTKTFETGQEDPGSELMDTLYVCFGDSIQLNPNAPILTSYNYSWTPTEQLDNPTIANPTAYVEEETTFTVRVSPSNDLCSFEETVTVVVLDRPVLAYETDMSCDGLTITFNNTSQNTDSYLWNFGDDTTDADTSILRSPTYAFPDTGSYNITLIADTLGRCADTLIQTLELDERTLQAAIAVDYDDCSETNIIARFRDVSINSMNNTASREWSFSTGETSTLDEPVLNLDSTQTIIATLNITTLEGCTTSTTDTFNFELITNVNFNDFVSVCAGSSVTLNPNGDTTYQYMWTPALGLDDPTIANPSASPDSTTTYMVTITNISADTCQITKSIVVSVEATPDLTVNDDVLTCDPTATIFTSSTNATIVEYLNETGEIVGSGSDTLTVPVSGSMDYTVRAFAANGCTTELPINISGGPVDISIDGDGIVAVCQGQELRLLVENKDPNDSLTYTWEPANEIIAGADTANPTISEVVGERTFYVNAVNQFGCGTTDSVAVAVIDTTFQLGFESQLQCDGQTVKFTNTSTNAFGYFWNFGDGQGISRAKDPSYSYAEPGTYQVYLTLQYDVSCTDTIFQEVEIFEPSLTPDFTFDYTNCDGANSSIQFNNQTATNINGALTYNWTFSNDETSNEENPIITLTESQELTAELCVTSRNGCESCASQVLDLTVIKVSLEDQVNVCPGESIPLNPTGDPSLIYQWTPTEGLDDPTAANPLATPTEMTTVYTVTVESADSNTCQVSQSITVNLFDEIDLTISPNNDTNTATTCGENAIITASSTTNGVVYEWTDADGNVVANGDILNVNPTDTATYYIAATANGCTTRDSITIINNGIDTDIEISDGGISGGDNQVCANTTLQLTATNNRPEQTLTYNWTASGNGTIINGGDTNMPTVMANGEGTAIFYLNSSNQFNCTFRDSIIVNITPFEPNIPDAVTACYDEATGLNPNGNPDYTYSWSPADNLDDPTSFNPMITTTEPANYSVTVTSGNCEATGIVMVDVTEEIDLTLTPNSETDVVTTCGEDAVITASSTLNGVTYEWRDGDGNIIAQGEVLTVNPTDSATYYLVASANGCTATDSVTVINNGVDLDITVSEGGTVGGDNEVCENSEFELVATNNRPEQTLTYDWSAGSNATIISGADTGTPTVMVNGVGAATFYLNSSNEFNCTYQDSIVVTITPFEPNIPTSVMACFNEPTPLNPNGNPDYTYSWSPADNLDNPNSFNPAITITEAATYTVTVTSGACQVIEMVAVDVLPIIDLITSKDTVLCEDTALTLFVNSNQPVEYAWSKTPDFADVISTDSTLTDIATGDEAYFIRATGINTGCTAMTSINVNNATIDIELAPEFNLCAGDEIELTATNLNPEQELTYFWSPTELIISGAESNSPSVSPATDATYSVDVENQFGCLTTASTNVVVTDLGAEIMVTASPDSIVQGSSTQLNATLITGYNYNWTPTSTLSQTNIANPVATPDATTTYNVEVSNQNCSITRSVEVLVINPQCQFPFIFVPNAFTPNGDGENDTFEVYGSFIEEMNLIIFNRWGQKVFESNNQQVGWDGTFNGQELAPDAFGYYLTLRCFGGQEYTTKGNVSLLR